MQELFQFVNFLSRQIPPLSLRQISQGKASLPDAAKAGNMHSRRFTHAADLTVSALMNGDKQMCLIAGRFQQSDLRRLDGIAVQHNGHLQALLRPGGVARCPDLVGFLHLMAGMGQTVGQLPVVGQQQQASESISSRPTGYTRTPHCATSSVTTCLPFSSESVVT